MQYEHFNNIPRDSPLYVTFGHHSCSFHIMSIALYLLGWPLIEKLW